MKTLSSRISGESTFRDPACDQQYALQQNISKMQFPGFLKTSSQKCFLMIANLGRGLLPYIPNINSSAAEDNSCPVINWLINYQSLLKISYLINKGLSELQLQMSINPMTSQFRARYATSTKSLGELQLLKKLHEIFCMNIYLHIYI